MDDRAYSLFTALVLGLKIPGLEATGLERPPAQPSPPLRLQHLLMELRQVIAQLHLGGEVALHVLHLRVLAARQVPQLARIGLHVEQLRRVHQARHVLPAAAADHHDGRRAALAHVLAHHLVAQRRAHQRGEQRRAVQRQQRVGRGADEVQEGRQQVHGRDGGADAARREPARRVHHQRHARRRLEPAHLVPQAALAQHVAVVAREHHDGVARQVRVAQQRHQLADLVVDVRAVGEVGAAGARDGLGRRCLVPRVDAVQDALRVWVLLGLRDRDGGFRDGHVGVLFPERLGGGVRVVRVGE